MRRDSGKFRASEVHLRGKVDRGSKVSVAEVLRMRYAVEAAKATKLASDTAAKLPEV